MQTTIIILAISLKGQLKAMGAFTYDSTGKKLRFRSNESHPMNSSVGLDLLMFFDETFPSFSCLTRVSCDTALHHTCFQHSPFEEMALNGSYCSINMNFK
ncbi:hypothetical protein PFLUV_G00193640 [Xyrichtys novacula]|uniref:Uncharacterized protein n=1 Tax=Xyrichtys novacula TaxID=13765 RepID=A0AAV1FSL2_XYRNO|nr:hypothetical protein PFLUV_G00193640 [Xyrichtys novacula]